MAKDRLRTQSEMLDDAAAALLAEDGAPIGETMARLADALENIGKILGRIEAKLPGLGEAKPMTSRPDDG